MMSTRKKRILVLLSCVVMALCFAVPFAAHAKESTQKVVRVGWYDSPFNYTDANGRRSGYAYEYQQKVAAHTGWEYEYVEGSWPELLEKLKTGEIDLMSDVSYTEERSKDMLFSAYPMGAEAYYAFIAVDNTEIKPGDFSSLNGKKVGVNKGSIQETLFRDWAQKNNVHAEVVELEGTEDESRQMLARGEIDAHVTIDAYGDTDVCVPVFDIGRSEFFFTLSNRRSDLQDELNMALSEIQDENPQYNQQLYDKYVRAVGANAFLASDEVSWLSEHGSVRVGYLDDHPPFCYADQTGELTGAFSEYLEVAAHAAQNADVEYTASPYTSISATLDALKAGEIDCVFPVNLSAYDGEELGVSATSPIMETEIYAVVRKTDQLGTLTEQGMTVAINEGDLNYEVFLAENYPDWNVVHCNGTEDGFRMVSSGEADCVLLSNYRIAQTERLREQYKLVPMPTGNVMGLSFATRRTDGALYHILDKTSNLVSSAAVGSALLAHS